VTYRVNDVHAVVRRFLQASKLALPLHILFRRRVAVHRQLSLFKEEYVRNEREEKKGRELRCSKLNAL
jgi:hypothetical protein